MKKFLLFIVISVAVVSLGFTIYRFSTNNEAIIIKNSAGYTINVGESIDLENVYEVENPSEYTTFTYSTDNATILSYNQEAESFTAGAVGGIANIIIKTSNRNFSELKVSVTVRDGSKDYPFLIANATQLANIGKGVFGYDKHYELQGDITLGDLGEYYRWTPIGYQNSQVVEFTGSLNGNGYTIYNLNVANAELPEAVEDEEAEGEEATESAESETEGKEEELPVYDGYDANYNVEKFANGAGLFYAIGKEGSVYNLNISTALIKGPFKKAGVIAGENKGLIHNITVSMGDVATSVGDSNIGGLVGNNNGEIYWSGLRGNVGISENSIANINGGGLVGYNNGKVYESYFVGGLLRNGTESNFGGIIGKNTYKTNGTVTESSFVYDTYAVITNNSANANGGAFGGIIGVNENYSDEKNNRVGGSYFGVANETGDIPTTWLAKSFVGGAEEVLQTTPNKKTLDELKSLQTYVRYSYPNGQKDYWSADVWMLAYGVNDGYPIINQDNTIKTIYPNEINIDYDSAINIASEEDFINYVSAGKGTFVITKDLDFTNYTGSHPNFQEGYWIPVSGDIDITITSNGVDANNDGVVTEDEPQYATIKGLKIKNIKNQSTDVEEYANVGLFETWNKGSISNVVFDGVTICGNAANNTGVLAGIASNVSVENVTIKNVSITCQGYNQTIGGLFGEYNPTSDYFVSGVEVNNLTFGESVFATVAGGIVGVMYSDGVIQPLYDEEGQLIKKNIVNGVDVVSKIFGGVVGVNYGDINYCNVSNINYNVDYETKNGAALYSTSKTFVVNNNTFANFAVGGIAGYSSSNATIQYANVDNTNNLKIFRTINDGIKGDARIYLGGIVGYSSSNINYVKSVANIEITFNSNYRGVTRVEYAPYVGGVVGVADAGRIKYAYFDGNINTPTDEYGLSIAGGLVGVVVPGQKVLFSYSEVTGYIKGYYAGVFAGLIGREARFESCAASGNKVEGVRIGGFVSIVSIATGNQVYVFEGCYSTYTLSGVTSNVGAEGAGFVWAYSKNSSIEVENNVLTALTSELHPLIANKNIKSSDYKYLANDCYFGINYQGSFSKKFAITSWRGTFVIVTCPGTRVETTTDRDYRLLGFEGNEVGFRYLNQKGLENTESDTKIKKYKAKEINEIKADNWTVTDSGITIEGLAYGRSQI